MSMTARPRAIVVADWERCSRRVFWVDELKALGVDLQLIRLADSLISDAQRDPTSLVRALETCNVLVLNFDSINGDPGFGSDIALSWIRYRSPELLKWVSQGGILIVEGQAMLAVPTQDSYDALFGHRELLVSRPSETLVPAFALESKRIGGDCKLTSQARKYNLFSGLAKPRCTTTRIIEDLFPGRARLMLGVANERTNWNLLYRGWFPRFPVLGQRFRWVPLIRTDFKKLGLFDHTVLCGARHGDGIIFASTMWIAGTGQTEIIRSLIYWNSQANPFPISERHAPQIVGIALSALISAIAAVLTATVLNIKGIWHPAGPALMTFFLWAAYLGLVWLVRLTCKAFVEFTGL